MEEYPPIDTMSLIRRIEALEKENKALYGYLGDTISKSEITSVLNRLYDYYNGRMQAARRAVDRNEDAYLAFNHVVDASRWKTRRDTVWKLAENLGITLREARMEGMYISESAWYPPPKETALEKLAQAQQAMIATGLPPAVPGSPALPGQTFPPPAPAPGQPAGAQPPASGGQK